MKNDQGVQHLKEGKEWLYAHSGAGKMIELYFLIDY